MVYTHLMQPCGSQSLEDMLYDAHVAQMEIAEGTRVV